MSKNIFTYYKIILTQYFAHIVTGNNEKRVRVCENLSQIKFSQCHCFPSQFLIEYKVLYKLNKSRHTIK